MYGRRCWRRSRTTTYRSTGWSTNCSRSGTRAARRWCRRWWCCTATMVPSRGADRPDRQRVRPAPTGAPGSTSWSSSCPVARGLTLAIEYNTDLFHASTIERLAVHLRTLLAAVVDDPDRPLSHLPLLDRGGAPSAADRSSTIPTRPCRRPCCRSSSRLRPPVLRTRPRSSAATPTLSYAQLERAGEPTCPPAGRAAGRRRSGVWRSPCRAPPTWWSPCSPCSRRARPTCPSIPTTRASGSRSCSAMRARRSCSPRPGWARTCPTRAWTGS